MSTRIKDIIAAMETLAPARLAEEWDNVGLQVGCRDWGAKRVWTALDPAPEVVEAACRENVNLLITHHPLLFRPLKSVDLGTSTGRSIAAAIQSRLGIFSAHTNLDSAAGGLNDLLAERIELTNCRVLDTSPGRVCRGMADDRATVQPVPALTGLGRIGSLDKTTTLTRLARRIKKIFDLKWVRIAGDPDLPVDRVAVCSGSGSSLLPDFFASGAQVYLSGDLGYHDARAVQEAGRGFIDIGHFASEHIVVSDLARRLGNCLTAAGLEVEVVPCGLEKDPFLPVP